MHDPPALVVQHDEHEEKPERGGRQDKEIDGCQAIRVIPQERPPRL
jgi:hypothetical protein